MIPPADAASIVASGLRCSAGIIGATIDADVITPTVVDPVIMLPTTPNTNGRKIAGSPVAKTPEQAPALPRSAAPSEQPIKPAPQAATAPREIASAATPSASSTPSPSSSVPAANDSRAKSAAATDRSNTVVVPNIDTRVVIRGDNLWQISRVTYGHGIRYTVIYKANRDQIRDPDLIYPGQIFVLPKERP